MTKKELQEAPLTSMAFGPTGKKTVRLMPTEEKQRHAFFDNLGEKI